MSSPSVARGLPGRDLGDRYEDYQDMRPVWRDHRGEVGRDRQEGEKGGGEEVVGRSTGEEEGGREGKRLEEGEIQEMSLGLQQNGQGSEVDGGVAGGGEHGEDRENGCEVKEEQLVEEDKGVMDKEEDILREEEKDQESAKGIDENEVTDDIEDTVTKEGKGEDQVPLLPLLVSVSVALPLLLLLACLTRRLSRKLCSSSSSTKMKDTLTPNSFPPMARKTPPSRLPPDVMLQHCQGNRVECQLVTAI